MALSEDLIKELNNFLESESFDIEKFNKLIHSIKQNKTIKFKLFDFEYFNEKRLIEIRKEKKVFIELQIFDKAITHRHLELECQKYVDLITKFKIEKSTFYYEQNYLFYFYFGTGKNDKVVREYLEKEI